jgi:lipoprotein-releasing system permease protein
LSEAAPFGAFERMLALRYLSAKRAHGGVALISVISFIGIALAVAVLIIVMSVMNGFREELVSRILGVNGHVFVDARGLDQRGVADLEARLRAVPGVTGAVALVEGQVMAVGPGSQSGALVRGLSPRALKDLKLVSDNIVAGSMDGFGAGEGGGDTVIIGYRLARTLGVLPGDVISLVTAEGAATPFGVAPRRKDYLVAGLFDVGMAEYDASFIYMPAEQAQLFFSRGDGIDRIELRLADPDDSPAITPQVQQIAGPTRGVLDWRQQNESYVNALNIERNVMRLILMLIVAIAAMNIISGLVMLVKNKTRDIAVLRTMGATQGSILRVFVMAGGALGGLGTLAGLAAGVLFCIFIRPIQDFVSWITGATLFSADVYYLSHIPATIEWSEVLFVTGWSLAMALVATLPPSWRAARLDPVEALRYE